MPTKRSGMELNNIYLMDCLEGLKAIPDKSIDLVVTDPPYEFNNGNGGGAFGSKKRDYHAEYISLCKETGRKTKETERLRIMANAQKNVAVTGGRHLSYGFDFAVLDECCRVLKKMNFYVWCSKAQVRKLLEYFEERGCNTDVVQDKPYTLVQRYVSVRYRVLYICKGAWCAVVWGI